MEGYAWPPQGDQAMDVAVNIAPAPPTSPELYHRGNPLWTVALLEDVRAQIQENVPLFLIHCIDGRVVQQQNLAYRNQSKWHTKVLFFGYRHLIDQRFQDQDLGLEYFTYGIRQRSLCDPDYPHLFPRYGIDKLEGEFKKALKDWTQLVPRGKLAGALLGLDIPPTIDKIVCFGLGNYLSTKLEYWTQHPAAITIRNILKYKLGRKPRILTHFPEYTPDTKAVLEKFGFEVIGANGVDGFVEVDENSLVFSTPSDIPVKQILAELARPAIIITRSFREADLDWVDKSEKSDEDHVCLVSWSLGMHDRFDPDTLRTKAMFADYTGIPLWEASGETAPGIGGSWLKANMQVYVRNKDYKQMKTEKNGFDSWFKLYD